MTLIRARIAIALILLIGIFALVALLLLHPVTLTVDAKVLVESAIGQLVLLLAFAIHAIFNAGAQGAPENPTQPVQPAQPKVLS